jgi:hypothetical protein
MPIDPNLLIAAAVLQDYFVDKDTGLPLAAGVVTCYQDNSRTTLKNWYYQSGTPGNYTYITLPNPLTLSGVGTIQDGNGNDVIPFFYAYDETSTVPILQPYYITVDDADGERQFTRENFPFVPNNPTPSNSVASNQNLITNSVFWRNAGSIDVSIPGSIIEINGDTIYYDVIAPSQHDGFIMQDIGFFKNETDATDQINFYKFVPPASNPTFPNQVLQNDVTPEFYLNIECSGAGTETQKYVQIPLQLHVKSLSGYTDGTLTIQAMSVPGNPNGRITVGIFQFLGTGVLSPPIVPQQTLTLGNSWQKYEINIPIPSAANLTLGEGGDDALYLIIGYPTASIFNINIAKPSFYLSDEVPTNDWETYDHVNSIISSPRTGDVRTTINSFYNFGWVEMNDGQIGSPTSNSNTRANTDTWLLFNNIWNIGKSYDSGANFNPIAQMYSSAGAATNYSSTAIGDFTLNKQLSLTKMLGRVILGTSPISVMLPFQKNTFTASSDGFGNLIITPSSFFYGFNGMPIVFTNSGGALPGGLVSNAVYYIASYNSGINFAVSTTFQNALDYIVLTFGNAGSGTNTVIASPTGTLEGEYGHNLLLDEMANHTHDSPGQPFIIGGGAAVYQGAANSGQTAGQTGTITGYTGQLPFNITQPGTFYNIFMKL